VRKRIITISTHFDSGTTRCHHRIASSLSHSKDDVCGSKYNVPKQKECVRGWESTTTRTADGLDFTAKGGKRQGREVPQSLRVKPGARHPVWKTRSKSALSEETSKV
jgi:hypothetical protein